MHFSVVAPYGSSSVAGNILCRLTRVEICFAQRLSRLMKPQYFSCLSKFILFLFHWVFSSQRTQTSKKKLRSRQKFRKVDRFFSRCGCGKKWSSSITKPDTLWTHCFCSETSTIYIILRVFPLRLNTSCFNFCFWCAKGQSFDLGRLLPSQRRIFPHFTKFFCVSIFRRLILLQVTVSEVLRLKLLC